MTFCKTIRWKINYEKKTTFCIYLNLKKNTAPIFIAKCLISSIQTKHKRQKVLIFRKQDKTSKTIIFVTYKRVIIYNDFIFKFSNVHKPQPK